MGGSSDERGDAFFWNFIGYRESTWTCDKFWSGQEELLMPKGSMS